MLWDPGSIEKDEEEVTPILVPLQSKTPPTGKRDGTVPVLVPDVQDLKDQFQQQQNMLSQIKETLIQNESQLSTKGKQVEVYANKLSQIRARSKNNQGKRPTVISVPSSSSPKMQKKSSKENLTKLEENEKSSGNYSKNRKGKVSELKKCLEENKIKFEQRTGKEQSDTRKIESLVEQLKAQLEERDKTIQDLQKTIEEPAPKLESLPKQKAKVKDSVASKTTQTAGNQPMDYESTEVISLLNKIYELEANVLDLEENLKEKESVIEARTQAVALLSQDLSLKGKNTLESLEETRQEMRMMQNNFIAIEDKLKKDLIDRKNRLDKLEEKYKKLESTNFELSVKNAEQQEKLVNFQAKYLEVEAERNSLKESVVQGRPDNKLEELNKKVNVLTKELDDRNKLMIKMKIEHKNKIKSLSKTLDTVKKMSDEKQEIVRLRSVIEELESVKTTLENRVAELEDEKASEKKLKDQINELEIIIKKQNEDLAIHLKTISNLEKENLDLIQTNQGLHTQIENLQKKIVVLENAEGDRFQKLEEEYSRKMEELKGEHRKEIEILECYYNTKGEGLDKKTLEEYRISAEINNIHVEEQIELLIREKQQLLENLKSLSGVSSTDSLTFEKMEHSDLIRDDKEISFPLGEEVQLTPQNTRTFHHEKIINDQQHLITDLQKTIVEQKEKLQIHAEKIREQEEKIENLEDVNALLKQQMEMSEATKTGKSSKTNTNTKNRLKKIEMELMQNKRTIQEQSEKLNDLGLKLHEKEELIKKYSEKIELFEKEDWDRQNHWQNTQDDLQNVQELQKKCLSLENSLFELNEDCERLRKENIEIVHLLSEEKVKRKKLLEELEVRQPENPEVEERIQTMSQAILDLEQKLDRFESNHQMSLENVADGEKQWEEGDLREKLEWTNVVLAGKETEIFRLQNLLEDRNSLMEILEMDLKEYKKKMEEKEKDLKNLTEELKAKEAQLGEISASFEKLQECVEVANQKTATNETQLKELLATVKEMEGDVFKKETELQEIKGILAEKNLDMTNLRNRLEEVNSDLTYSYQEHLENMGKCLRDKESDYDNLLVEKTHLESINRTLVTEKEDCHNQKVEILNERDKLKNLLLEKEKSITELSEKLEKLEVGKEKSEEMQDLKIKLKKVAANLKKKAQNEADLTKTVKEFEEKWQIEKTEKQKLETELSEILVVKAAAEDEKERLTKELEGLRVDYENHVKELKSQVLALEETCSRLQIIEREDKEKITQLELKTAELFQLHENAKAGIQNQKEIQSEKECLLQKLSEITVKHEELQFQHSQTVLEKSELEKKVEDKIKSYEKLQSEKCSLDAKIQEKLAVIESMETELQKAQDQVKVVEEKFFHSEDRRLSLENKNEEMCKKILENSENRTTIDDLSVRVDELLKSEKFLQSCVKSLEFGNAELKQILDKVQTEKFELEKELKSSSEKIVVMGEELKELRNTDGEKNNLIRDLSIEVEKLKTENKQILSEFEKLNRDYDQFEFDFKENLENSQNLEKSLRHKIEELLNENANLTEKCNFLLEGREEVSGAEKKPKKRKSVTFRTDNVEYIKELKNQLHNYDASLKQANKENENLKAELFRERLRHEVTDVLVEARAKVESFKSTPEKKEPVLEPPVRITQLEETSEERKFDANAFFGSNAGDSSLMLKNVEPQTSEFDSLMWDDGWGSEGNLEAEYLSGKMIENEKPDYELKIKTLESEVSNLKEENGRLTNEVKEQMAKYTKALKKLKEMKMSYDKLQAEAAKAQSSSDFGDLDATIVDELKSQMERMEIKEKELLKNLENTKLEKESLLKRIDVLSAGNEKFIELKERQDNEVEIWQRKNNELLKEMAELRQQLSNPDTSDGDVVLAENRELKNKVEALEWKNCELSELLEEKQELLEEGQIKEVARVMEEKSQLQKEIDELNNVKEILEKKLSDEEKKNTLTIGELNEQLTALASENETLQDILGEMKASADAVKKGSKQQQERESNIFDYFKSSPSEELFPIGASDLPNGAPGSNQQPKIAELESALKQKEEELSQVREKLEAETGLRNAELNELQLEKEKELSCLRQSMAELERLISVKETENLEAKQSTEILLKRIQELENATQLKEQFETVDLNSPVESESEALQQRIFDLENLLGQREDEFHQMHQMKLSEIEDLRQRIFQLEDSVQSAVRQDGSEVDALRRKVLELEEYARFKEREYYQLNGNLQKRVFELESLLEGAPDQQRLFELESLLGFKEAELRQKTIELENLSRKTTELETLLPVKDEEIRLLMTRLSDLEKNYNDSKLEIERLLNEEKLNVEEKFVEPFQENMKIPVAFEVEAMSRTLEEEKQKTENLQYELSERNSLLGVKENEIQFLNGKLTEMKNKLEELQEEGRKQKAEKEDSFQMKARLEKIIADLQKEMESLNLQLSVARRELEEFQKVKDEAMAHLKSQSFVLETELEESRERERVAVAELRSELEEKRKHHESMMKERREEEEKRARMIKELEKDKEVLEKDVGTLRKELEQKEKEIESLVLSLEQEKSQVADVWKTLQVSEAEVADLRGTLSHVQQEIGHFRDFEKQVKELRAAQIKEGGFNVPVTSEGHPDLSDWTENELAELSTRLQSDLDTALYMLHQRDVRCDELTFELMQLLEERDTLQLRLSTALRINEELRSFAKHDSAVSSQGLQENKDLLDQSNDRQPENTRAPREDLLRLASKISELHSVSYLRDKTVKDESVQRHKEQMNLLSRVSDSDITLSRDVQSSPAVLLNWMRGKTTPKVMHI